MATSRDAYYSYRRGNANPHTDANTYPNIHSHPDTQPNIYPETDLHSWPLGTVGDSGGDGDAG